jgi:hypothetical protein
MSVSLRKDPYVIPKYSLTGDLLAYLKCPRQYRYYNRGALPPSAPVQLWFGEFIHGVMEESFDRWRTRKGWRNLPWNWEKRIRDIEMTIFKRLASRGLTPPPPLFRRYDDDKPADRRIASFRAEQAINTWGPHLFQLIVEAEVRLSGTRPMPALDRPRADYYGITGVVDVVSSVRLLEAAPDNKLVSRLLATPSIARRLLSGPTEPFDIIIDYKGMRRPPRSSKHLEHSLWHHQEWQLQTYAWLRKLQAPERHVIAGVLLYLNELYPSVEDVRALRQDIRTDATDVPPVDLDLGIVSSGPLTHDRIKELSQNFREERSIRIVTIESETLTRSLSQFDGVVSQIEGAIALERTGDSVKEAWQPRPDASTCTACDFKYHCDGAASFDAGEVQRRVTVP